MGTISGDTSTIGEAGVSGVFGGDPRIVDGRDFAAGVLGLASGQAAVWGIAAGGPGVLGQVQGDQSVGVLGQSDTDPDTALAGVGVQGVGAIGVVGNGDIGILGDGAKNGVVGQTRSDIGAGVNGRNDGKGNGVSGFSRHGIGVRGDSTNGFAAVHGHGAQNGVWGFTLSPNDSGVFGQNDGKGSGVTGFSKDGLGVRGDSTNGFAAVHGNGGKNGVFGFTTSENSGVLGSNEGKGAGVSGISKNGIGVFGIGPVAGRFEGDVQVTGDITLTGIGQDCAEDFDVTGTGKIEAGTVMVIDQMGALIESEKAYDKRVAGVVSGAGEYKPAILLGKQEHGKKRTPIALIGKVYCKVDAQYSPVEVGDLLTTSPTPGYAMKADDPLKAFGSVIGKALRPIAEGQGLIPILVALQ
jgi:hypothetical protein